MVERTLRIGVAPRVLEAHLVVPTAARAGAVLCHPHPEYGGSMDNAVVVAAADALAARGLAVLRFNFGSVGASGGCYSGGPEEVTDARAAVAALAGTLADDAPLILVGYSFGAWVALQAAADTAAVRGVVAIAPPLRFFDWSFLARVAVPLAVVVGDRDDYCPPARLDVVRARGAVRVIAGADHFLAGREREVAAAVVTEGIAWAA